VFPDRPPAGLAVIPRAGATGEGELVGTEALEMARMVAGELGTEPHLPYLPLLPERGPGSDAIGRTAALLTTVSTQFAVSTTPAGWRLAGGDSREMRRARSWLGEDLDALESQLGDFGRHVIVPVVGPWTMAASLELMTGHRLVRDPSAVFDLAQALAQAVADHAAELRRRLPSATPIVRLDEPLLPAVLAGALATPSGFDRYRMVTEQVASERLATVVGGSDVLVRCAGGLLPLAVLAASGAVGVSVDLSSVDLARDGDQLGMLVDAGRALFFGVRTERGNAPLASVVGATVSEVSRLWTNLGFDLESLPGSVALQPSAGRPAVDPVGDFELLRAVSARLREVRVDE